MKKLLLCTIFLLGSFVIPVAAVSQAIMRDDLDATIAGMNTSFNGVIQKAETVDDLKQDISAMRLTIKTVIGDFLKQLKKGVLINKLFDEKKALEQFNNLNILFGQLLVGEKPVDQLTQDETFKRVSRAIEHGREVSDVDYLESKIQELYNDIKSLKDKRLTNYTNRYADELLLAYAINIFRVAEKIDELSKLKDRRYVNVVNNAQKKSVNDKYDALINNINAERLALKLPK